MCTLKEIKCSFSNVSTNLKVTAVESALEQTISNLRDLVIDYEQLRLNCKDFETQYLAQKEKCESKTCSGSLELKKVNQTKDNTIQAIASALTKLYETRDFNTISEIFSIICGENTPDNEFDKHDAEPTTVSNCAIPEDIKKEKILDHDESVSEIEGTPTGRKSPIILTKKSRNVTNISTSREKKKSSGDWCTPEKKVLKLSFPTPNKTPNGRLKQSRLHLVKVKTTSVVDLTNSPEIKRENETIQCNVKQEELDDETILPSPSGLVNFQSLQKSLKSSPSKFKKPLSLKLKIENSKANGQNENIADVKEIDGAKEYPESSKFEIPTKKEAEHLESKADESMSLLRHIGTFAAKPDVSKIPSPTKRPLVENTNAENIRNQLETESSMSILNNPPTDHMKSDYRTKNVEPIYKEPTVRKKSEKRALPGWSCEECKMFYDELYRDNPVMLARKMEECSKHRGRRDPVRPRTPPGFWDPRWDVPDDTEEFNRRNNAI